MVVVGGGNAALCAALSAREHGARVILLERAPEAERGGNSRFTAGAMRFAYRSPAEIRALIPELPDEKFERLDFGVYPPDTFLADLSRMTDGRSDPALSVTLVERSQETMT